MEFATQIEDLKIRFAKEEDSATIYDLIRELAEYEKMVDQLTATKETLHESLFIKHQAEVLIGEYKGRAVGYALFFHNFSTFQGKAALYLEDVFVKPECRGKGLGKAFFRCLAQLCADRNCERMDWVCLDWNRPSRDFYEKLGAKCLAEWIGYRLEGQALEDTGKFT